MKAKLTDHLVKSTAGPAAGFQFIWDTELKGFGLRVTAAGTKSFVIDYVTVTGQSRRMTLGQYPALSVAAARKMATEARGRAYAGEDPLQAKRSQRFADGPREPTLGDLRGRYMIEHVEPLRTAEGRQNERTYWRALEELGMTTRLSEITRARVQQLHRSMSRTPIQANRTITSLATAFRLAISWGWASDNPATSIARNAENPRERYLTEEEARRLQAAIDGHAQRTSALAIRFLLLTGARRGETLRARWADIDMKAGVWAKPAQTTKARRTHRVILSSAAVRLLEELRASNPESAIVFPGKSRQPLTDIKRTWDAIRTDAGLPAFRLHDLRHSHASFIASKGGSLLLIGQALGHSQASTTLRYAHLTDASRREAAEMVGDLVMPQNEEAE